MPIRHAAVAAALAVILSACGGGGSRFVPTDPGTVTPPNNGGNNPPVVTPPTLGVTKIMAFGDSLTEGESLGQLLTPALHDTGGAGVSSSYPAKLLGTLVATYTNQTSALKVFNQGRGGEKVVGSGARDRLRNALLAQQPDILLLLHGVNDINDTSGTVPVQQVAEAIEELLELAAQHNVKHVFVGNLPQQKATTKATGGARIGQFNALLPAIVAEEGATLIDLNSAIALDMLMPDGLHITEAGNVKMAETFYAAIKARYHQNPQ